MEISLSPGRLMGAFNAGVADEAWDDLPMPMLSNPRVRFWFIERGWRAYGLRVLPPHLQHSATPPGPRQTHTTRGLPRRRTLRLVCGLWRTAT